MRQLYILVDSNNKTIGKEYHPEELYNMELKPGQYTLYLLPIMDNTAILLDTITI